MKLAFPQMGDIRYLLGDLLDRLEISYLIPAKVTENTLALGSKYAPEFSCLPLKLNIGSFIESIKAGADTLIMAGGKGPCRFGYYGEVEKRILKQIGYNFEMVIVEPPSMGLGKFIGPIKKVSGKSTRQIWRALRESFPKAIAYDQLKKKVLQTRCYEVVPGSITKAYKKAVKVLGQAKEPEEIQQARTKALAIIDEVEKDINRPVLKVGIVGEFYILLEPFANFDLEEWLGNRGVYIEKSVYLSDWINPSRKNPVGGVSEEELKELAKPYLNHFVGGEGLPSIALSVNYAKRGFDGVIHMFPFTCMPDTIAKAILPRVSRDYDIPIIHFTIDEQTGKAGVATRLEAFLDLLANKRGVKASSSYFN
jgi:predicted nucleotide-binding protein (sugar kinase/HSP70/actin superfamily)